MRSKRFGMIAFLIGLVLVLAGCVHVRQEVTLKANEEWYVKSLITFPKSTVDQLGEEGLTGSEQDFEKTTEEAAAKGVKAHMEVRKESNGDVVYEITLEGKGLALLNESAFENKAEIKLLDNGHVKFRYDAGDVTSITAMGGSYTFVLKAGKAYSHNATKVEGGALVWENPTKAMEAEVGASAGAAGGFPLWLLILLIVVLVIVVIVVLLYVRGQQLKRGQAAPTATYTPPAPTAPVAPVEPPAPPSEPPPPSAPAQ